MIDCVKRFLWSRKAIALTLPISILQASNKAELLNGANGIRIGA